MTVDEAMEAFTEAVHSNDFDAQVPERSTRMHLIDIADIFDTIRNGEGLRRHLCGDDAWNIAKDLASMLETLAR